MRSNRVSNNTGRAAKPANEVTNKPQTLAPPDVVCEVVPLTGVVPRVELHHQRVSDACVAQTLARLPYRLCSIGIQVDDKSKAVPSMDHARLEYNRSDMDTGQGTTLMVSSCRTGDGTAFAPASSALQKTQNLDTTHTLWCKVWNCRSFTSVHDRV